MKYCRINMFHVACINQMHKIFKETNKYIWIYECNLNKKQLLTCFGPSCGHLRDYKNKNTNSTNYNFIFVFTSLSGQNLSVIIV